MNETNNSEERKCEPINIGACYKPVCCLNLFAGVGGNRKDWPANIQVTAVELDPRIAAIYQKLYPNDIVIVADAHQYLLEHYNEFDFIWSSPPCQSHSRMQKATRHNVTKYIDLMLYQEIIFLQHFFKGKWVVENVKPYYEPLVKPNSQIGRHLFWSNFDIKAEEVKQTTGFINKCNMAGKQALMDWLGIHFEEVVYYGKNHDPAQILRNCVHPKLGAQVFFSNGL